MMVLPSRHRDESVVMVDGPWRHRTVTAAGTRFHVVEAGEGPLVLFLHGFPQFWWSWQRQLVSVAAAGYRAVAVDVRGYGASDKPPHGYDPVTLASDAASLVRALGEARGVVVGHGSGGLVAWTMAAYFPRLTRRLAVLSMPHPMRLAAAPRARGGLRHGGRLIPLPVSLLPERRLLRDDAEPVARLLRDWSRPGWPDPATERLVRAAVQIPGVASNALEHYRWLFRSPSRPDGGRYRRRMGQPIRVPTLHLHGMLDTAVPPWAALGSDVFVDAPYQWRAVEDAGHFPHQEQPETVDSTLIGWLDDPGPDR